MSPAELAVKIETSNRDIWYPYRPWLIMKRKFLCTVSLLGMLAAGIAASSVHAADANTLIVLYDPLSKTDGRLTDALEDEGWTVVSDHVPHGEGLGKLLKEQPRALCIWHPEGNDLPTSVWTKEIADFVRNGGTLFLSAHGNLDLTSYFPDEECAVRWSGWAVDPDRKTTYVKEDWPGASNSLGRAFAEGISPSSGYQPDSDGWEVLAKMRMMTGEEFPYLLTRSVGRGMIVLTSSDLGVAGGYEMFGSNNLQQAALLIDQFLK